MEDISEPIFFFFKIFSKFFLDSSSIDSGETAIGNGFRLPLVISTSIKPNDFKKGHQINSSEDFLLGV